MTRCLLRPLRGGIFSAQCQECRLEIKDYGLLKHLSRGFSELSFRCRLKIRDYGSLKHPAPQGFSVLNTPPRGIFGAECQGCCLKNTRALRVE